MREEERLEAAYGTLTLRVIPTTPDNGRAAQPKFVRRAITPSSAFIHSSGCRWGKASTDRSSAPCFLDRSMVAGWRPSSFGHFGLSADHLGCRKYQGQQAGHRDRLLHAPSYSDKSSHGKVAFKVQENALGRLATRGISAGRQ